MKRILFLGIALLISGLSFGQLTGIKSIPGDYASVTAAVADLNTVGVGVGGVTFNIAAGYTETIAAPISITATGTVSDPIIFQKSGVGANPLITAFVGVSTPGSAVQDGIWNLIGSDYVTIDGIDLIDPNTTNPATMEYGFGFFKASVSDGCQYNTIQNCTVTLSINNNASGSGPAVNGSRAINVVNSLVTTQTTAVTPTAASGTNSYNHFYSNTLQFCDYGIALIGYAGSTPFTLCDFGNDVGGSSIATGNIIKNFGGATAASNPAAGVRTLAQYDINISYNTINNNDGAGVNHPSTLRGIFSNTATSANCTISRNTLTIKSGTTGASQVSVIENSAGSTAAGNTININYNTITGGSNSTTTSGIYYCIYNSSTAATVNINNNLITGNVVSGTSTTPFIETGSPATVNVNNNQIINNTRDGLSGTWYLVKTTSPTNLVVDGNIINNNNWTNVASTGITYGFYGLSSSVNVTITNNTVSNMLTPTTGSIYGIREFGTAGNKTIQSNQVFNLVCGAGGTIYGIYTSTGTVNISKNNVYSLNSLNGTGGLVYGIYSSGGTTIDIYNNFVSDLAALGATGTNAINGIYLGGGTTINAYYNTVYLNATSSSASTFGTSGIYASTSSDVKLINNVIVNNSTPIGTAYTVAYRRSGTTLTSYNNASNNNLFYAGAPGPNNLIFYDGTNMDQDIAAFQTRVSPRDNVSVSELPPFVNIATTPFDLHMQTTIATKTESGGKPIAITVDYDGDMRNGSTPDIGADEFSGIPSYTCVAPTPGNTISSSTSLCFGESISLSLQNATSGTGVTYQWQSSPDGVTYSNIPGAILATYNTTPLVMTWYQCIVTCANGPVSTTSTPVQVSFTHSVTSSAGASRCGAGSLSLTATGSAGTTINWYTAATGGTSVGTGSPWTTPVITGTTSYYASAELSSIVTGNVTIGTGTTTNGSTAYPTAFGNYWYQSWHQYVITAAELQAAGMVSGNINSISFNLLAVPSPNTPPTNYQISIGTTTNTTLSAWETSGLTTCFGPAAPPALTPGWNTITFTTPYNWDGVSNILIDIRGTELYGSGNATTYNSTTAGNTTLYAYTTTNNASFWTSNPTPTASTSRMNTRLNGSITTVCTSPRVEVVATIGASPALTVTPDQEVCNNTGASISVTSTLADYDSYVWTPETDLYTDAGCTVPYVAGASASTVYVKSTTAGVVTYTCTANNSSTMCSNIATTDVTILPGVATITATPASLCNSGTSSLTLSPASGWGTATYQWMNSTDNVTFSDIVGANANSYTTPTLTDTMYYKLVVELGASVCEESDTATVYVILPAIVSTTPGSHCGAGTVNLEAQGSGGTVIRWYDAMTGGTPLSTGNTFTTPSISTTTDFYAEAGVVNLSVNDSVGSYVLPVGPSSSSSTDAGIVITTTEDGVLITGAQIFVQGTGNITFQLQTSAGTPIATHIAAISGATTSAFYPVSFPSTFVTGAAGTYRVLATAKDAGITWYYPAMTYPINSASGIVTITSGWGWGSTYSDQMRCIHNIDFYYEDVCASPRTAVTATISAAPAISVSATPATICQGESTDLEVTSTNDPDYDYEWDGGLIGATQTVTPSGTTIYNVTATDNSGGTYDGCITTGSVTVSVNPSPSSVTANATDNDICIGTAIDLTSSAVAGDSYTDTIFSESFENAGAIPSGWAENLDADGNATSATLYYTTTSSWPSGFSAYDGSYFVRFNSYSVQTGNSARLMNTTGFSTTGITNAVINFAWTQDDGYTNDDNVVVEYSLDGTTWISTGDTITRASASGDSWTFQSVNLPTAAQNQSTVYIAFLFTSAYGNDCHLDDVSVTSFIEPTPAFAWTSNPAGFTSNSQDTAGVVPTATTEYIVTVGNSYGCYTSASTTVTVNPIPVVNLGSDQSICDTSSVTLDAGNLGSTFDWSTGGTSQTEVFDGSVGAGSYDVSVEVTNAAGCVASDTVTITVTVCDGINEPNVRINMYPNPVSDLLNIDLSELSAGSYRFELISLTGQRIMNEMIINNGQIIPVRISDVETGSYLVRISNATMQFQGYISVE